MNRLGLLVLTLCSVAAVGCDASDYTVFVLRNQVITDGCTVPDGTGTDFRSVGQLDVTSPEPGTGFVNPGYFFSPAIENGTVADPVQINAHIVYLEGADVELKSNGSDASDALIAALNARGLAKRTQHFSGSIPPASTAGVGFFVIDDAQTAAMNDVLSDVPVQVLCSARVFGTIDHNDVEADAFVYPVTVCKGCEINFLGACPTDSTGTTFNTGGICNPLQDGLIDCCTQGGATVCPPPTTTSTGS